MNLNFLLGWRGYVASLGTGLLIGLGLGYTLTHTYDQVELLTIQSSFDQYKLVVLQDAAQASQETVSKLRLAQDRERELKQRLDQRQDQLQKTSQRLTEALNNATQTSTLSPAVIDYLSRLREYQQSHH